LHYAANDSGSSDERAPTPFQRLSATAAKWPGRAVPLELKNAILACLDKNHSKRPQTARGIANLLVSENTAATISNQYGQTINHV